MSKKLWWMVGIVAIVILVGWRAYHGQQRNSGTIKIGVLAPLTGNAAVLGERMRNGAELAKEDVLKSGEVKSLSMIYEDACQPTQAVSAAQKLLDVDRVSFIGGSLCLIGFDAVTPITEARKVIAFNTAANPDADLNKNYVFSTNIAIRDDAAKLADYAYNTMHARTAAIIHFETSFGNDYNKYLTQYFEARGGKIVFSEGESIDASDFRTELTKIKALRPDVTFTVHWASSLGNFLRQAKDLRVSSKMLGYYEDEDPTVLKFAGSAAEGFIISSSEPQPETDTMRAFNSRYEARYRSAADVLAWNAYDAIRLGVAAYTHCNGDTSCMARWLHQVKDYPGVSGTITIQADGSAKKPTVFKMVKGGKFLALPQ